MGFHEAFGKLELSFGPEKLTIDCRSGKDIQFEVTLYTDRGIVKIDELKNSISGVTKNGSSKNFFETRYVSEMATLYLEQIMKGEVLTLPRVSDSIDLHLPFIQTITSLSSRS